MSVATPILALDQSVGAVWLVLAAAPAHGSGAADGPAEPVLPVFEQADRTIARLASRVNPVERVRMLLLQVNRPSRPFGLARPQIADRSDHEPTSGRPLVPHANGREDRGQLDPARAMARPPGTIREPRRASV